MDTRKQIVEAMFELMSNYPIEKITVEMIADRCKMARSSFYRYFQDKYQLMAMTYVFLSDKLIAEDLKNRDWASALEKILQFMLDNKSAFVNMFKIEGQDSFYKFLYAHNLKLLRETYLEIKAAKNVTLYETCMMELYTSGMVHLQEKWVTSEIPISPAEMANIILNGMPALLKTVMMDPSI